MLTDTGLLVISSPYTWKPEHTEPDNWIGGLEREGRELTTKEGLCQILGPDLELLDSLREDIQRSHWSSSYIAVLSLVESSRVSKYFHALKGAFSVACASSLMP